MRRGDLLFINYRLDPIGYLIRYFTHSKWNHVAMFVSNEEIIEAKRGGIFVNNCNKYVNKVFYKYEIVPSIRVSSLGKNIVAKEALTQQGKMSQFKWAVTFAMLLFKINKKTPRLSCSGFIASVFSRIGVCFAYGTDIYKITPEDIYQTVSNINKMKNFNMFIDLCAE